MGDGKKREQWLILILSLGFVCDCSGKKGHPKSGQFYDKGIESNRLLDTHQSEEKKEMAKWFYQGKKACNGTKSK